MGRANGSRTSLVVSSLYSSLYGSLCGSLSGEHQTVLRENKSKHRAQSRSRGVYRTGCTIALWCARSEMLPLCYHDCHKQV